MTHATNSDQARTSAEVAAELKLGAFVLRPPDATEAIRRFRVAEWEGYDAAFATQVNGADSMALMAAASVLTRDIEIGVGVSPIYLRTPTSMAQSAATLWDLSGGRIKLGLGSGHRLVMQRWYGAAMERPVAEMREYVAIMRGVLDGEPLKKADRWASDMPLVGIATAPEMPLLIGALSPAMLRLAGEVAQGVMVWLATPGYFEETVIPHVREGRARIGKTLEGFDVVASIPVAVTDDPESVRRLYVRQIAHNLRLPFYRAILERHGYLDDLALINEVDAYEDLENPMPESAMDSLASGALVRDIAAIGDGFAVVEKLAEYRRAGVTYAGINPVRISDYDASLAAVARALGRPPRTAAEDR
ncbi:MULTISPECIES: LLM class flavin-dependent oxidoreductase [unclassified Nocardioides]|uniref:LLM class flavin-dependent oxidoreductase n=1 Tax=unclassified Nocardioides TaxID=2615069 RepID=UPI0000571AA1|nr:MULTISPECIES: LLM class flavin-dependent oxidoreductase [unclassified Nocardioides]ABL80338.1 luciferase family protein [Nocardioides sp. JS614]